MSLARFCRLLSGARKIVLHVAASRRQIFLSPAVLTALVFLSFARKILYAYYVCLIVIAMALRSAVALSWQLLRVMSWLLSVVSLLPLKRRVTALY